MVKPLGLGLGDKEVEGGWALGPILVRQGRQGIKRREKVK
jgi:hypothetical protein